MISDRAGDLQRRARSWAAQRVPGPVRSRLRKPSSSAPPAETLSPTEQFESQGFVVLPSFFTPDQMREASQVFDELWAQRSVMEEPVVIDAYLNADAPSPSQRIRLAHAPDAAREHVYKLNDLYLVDERVRALVLCEPLAALLRELIDDEVVVINSLHLERGTTQGLHTDTFFMEAPPGGRLVVSSICLEDVHPDAGPLQYVPRSHLIEPFRNADGTRTIRDDDELHEASMHYDRESANNGLAGEPFCGKAGDVFIWHEQLRHGGLPIRDMRRTRRTIVTHYWGRSSIGDHPDLRQSHAAYYLARDHQDVPH